MNDVPRLPEHLNRPRLRRAEACEYLEKKHGLIVAQGTMAKYATVGGGPAYQKASRTPLYMPVELDRWAVERLGRLIHNSSET